MNNLNKPLALVVDDDFLICWMIREKLQSNGINVLEAYSVTEAKSLLDNHSIDILILDYILPDGSGISALSHLDSFYRPQKIVLISAILGSDQLDKICMDNCIKFVPKSNIDDLFKYVLN